MIQETETQFRIVVHNRIGTKSSWRSELPTREEMAEWRDYFACPVWVEKRVVTYSEPLMVPGL